MLSFPVPSPTWGRERLGGLMHETLAVAGLWRRAQSTLRLCTEKTWPWALLFLKTKHEFRLLQGNWHNPRECSGGEAAPCALRKKSNQNAQPQTEAHYGFDWMKQLSLIIKGTQVSVGVPCPLGQDITCLSPHTVTRGGQEGSFCLHNLFSSSQVCIFPSHVWLNFWWKLTLILSLFIWF